MSEMTGDPVENERVLAALADLNDAVRRTPSLPVELLALPARLETVAKAVIEVQLRVADLSDIGVSVGKLEQILTAILEALQAISAQSDANARSDASSARHIEDAIALRLGTIQDAVLAIPALVEPVAGSIRETNEALRAMAHVPDAIRDAQDTTLSVSYLVEPIAGALRDTRDALDRISELVKPLDQTQVTNAIEETRAALRETQLAVQQFPELVEPLAGAARQTQGALQTISEVVEPVADAMSLVVSTTEGLAGTIRETQQAINQFPEIVEPLAGAMRETQDTVSRMAATTEALARAFDSARKEPRTDLTPAALGAAVASVLDRVLEPIRLSLSNLEATVSHATDAHQLTIEATGASVSDAQAVVIGRVAQAELALGQLVADLRAGHAAALREAHAETVRDTQAAIEAALEPLHTAVSGATAAIAGNEPQTKAAVTDAKNELAAAIAGTTAQTTAAIADTTAAIADSTAQTTAAIADTTAQTTAAIADTAAAIADLHDAVRATRAAAESLSNSLSDASLRSDQRATEATPALAAAMASVLDRVLDPLRATLGTLEAAVGTTTAVATENRDALRALRVATNSEPAVAEIIRTELLGHRRASQQDTGLESVKTELIEEVRRQLQSGPTESLDALHDAVVLNTEALRDALEGDGANAATLAEMRQAIDQLTTSLSGLDGRALIEEVRTTNGGSTDQAAAAVEQIRQATAELTGELTRVVGHAATAAVVAAAAEAVAPAAAQAAVQHVADVLPDLVARAVADHIELATDPLDVIVREATEAALSRAVISAPDREEQPTAEIADVLDAVEAAVLEGAAAAARAEEAAHAAESAARGAEEAATGAAEAAESAADAARGATDAAHGTTDAVWQAAAQLIPPGESVDTDRLTDTITHALTDAVSAMRPPAPAIEGGELTAAMIASVATALDQFGERVDADLDRMGARLAAVADVLERTLAAVEEMATRRGARGEALDLLRQIAAETTSDVRATNNRRRNSVRGTLQK